MNGLFYGDLPSKCSKLYEGLHGPKGDRFDARFARAREHCEVLWSEFCEFADPNFKREFATKTHERWFEMYLTVSLDRAGYEVKCPKPGPDLLLHVGGKRIWIEAVCASSGELGRPDSVPRMEPELSRCASESCAPDKRCAVASLKVTASGEPSTLAKFAQA